MAKTSIILVQDVLANVLATNLKLKGGEMINCMKKGQRNEKWLENYFCDQGIWNIQTSYKAPHVKFNKCHDIFNVFDGCAIEVATQNIILWQLKTNKSDYYGFKKKLIEFKRLFMDRNNTVRLVLFLKEKNKLRIFEDGKERIEPILKFEKKNLVVKK